MDHICPQFLHVFSVNFCVILNKFSYKRIVCYVCGRCVKDFKEVKYERPSLTFLYSVSYMPPSFDN